MPMNVGAAITPAVNHTARLLFRPFGLRNWLALGFVSLFAECGGGGGGGFNNYSPSKDFHKPEMDQFSQWMMQHMLLLILGFIVLFVIGIALQWIGSVLKFVYVNQIIRDPKAIREPFARFLGLGTSYFLWELALGLVILFTIAILIGVPAALLFPLFHTMTAIAILGIVFLIILLVILVITAAIISVIARDFVLTTMFVRNIKVIEAWHIVLPIVRANAGQTALYILLLIAYAVVAAIGGMFVVMAVMILFLIPGGLLALIGYGIYSMSGSVWSAPLIAYAALFGTALFLAFVYVAECSMQPFIVFRRAFALVVLGQADQSLVTVPIFSYQGPTPGEGVGG